MYTRAAASDYDDWEIKYSNPGWGARDLIPLLKKVSMDHESCQMISNFGQAETYQGAPGQETHGYSGPLKVSYGGIMTDIGREFIETAPQYDSKRGATEDTNTFYECNKYAVST